MTSKNSLKEQLLMLNNQAPENQAILKNDKFMNNKRFVTAFSLMGIVLLSGCSSVQWREGSIFERNGGARAQDEYVVYNGEEAEEQASEAEQKPDTNQQEPAPIEAAPEVAVVEAQAEEVLPEETQEDVMAAAEPLPEENIAEAANRVFTPAPYPAGDQDADDLRLKENLESIISRSSSKSDIPAQMQDLELLLQEKPDSSGILYHLGRLAFFNDQPDQAVQYLDQALEIEDKNFYAANLLGLVYRSQGQFDRAEAAYKQALKIWPDYATAWYNLGILQDLYRNNLADALVAYKNYLAIDESKTSESEARTKTRQHVELWVKDLEMRLSRQ